MMHFIHLSICLSVPVSCMPLTQYWKDKESSTLDEMFPMKCTTGDTLFISNDHGH